MSYSPRASAVKDYVKFLDEVEKIIGFKGVIIWQKKQIKTSHVLNLITSSQPPVASSGETQPSSSASGETQQERSAAEEPVRVPSANVTVVDPREEGKLAEEIQKNLIREMEKNRKKNMQKSRQNSPGSRKNSQNSPRSRQNKCRNSQNSPKSSPK